MSAQSSLHERGVYERALEKADIVLRPERPPAMLFEAASKLRGAFPDAGCRGLPIILNGQTSMPRTLIPRGPLPAWRVTR